VEWNHGLDVSHLLTREIDLFPPMRTCHRRKEINFTGKQVRYI